MGLISSVWDAMATFEASGAEKEAHSAIERLLAAVNAPVSRATFEPGHLTASAAVRDPDRGKLLLIHHAKLDRWLQPGGHIEPGDATIEAAARREVLEETGLSDLTSRGVVDLDIHQIPARVDEPAHLHFDIRFLFDVAVSGSAAAIAGDGALAVRWIGLDDLAHVHTDDSVLRLFRKALS